MQLRVKNPQFVKSCGSKKDFLSDKPQIVFAGKSNSGKSSLINLITNNNKMARVGQTPGLTVLVNYFSCTLATGERDLDFYLVDLPGYGYAKSGKSRSDDFGKLVEDFFEETKNKLVFVLMDIRNKPSSDDKQLIQFLYANQIAFVVVLTKADKLSKAQMGVARQNQASELGLGIDNVIVTSSTQRTGTDAILRCIMEHVSNLS